MPTLNDSMERLASIRRQLDVELTKIAEARPSGPSNIDALPPDAPVEAVFAAASQDHVNGAAARLGSFRVQHAARTHHPFGSSATSRVIIENVQYKEVTPDEPVRKADESE